MELYIGMWICRFTLSNMICYSYICTIKMRNFVRKNYANVKLKRKNKGLIGAISINNKLKTRFKVKLFIIIINLSQNSLNSMYEL